MKCPNCGKEYDPGRWQTKTCSVSCAVQYRYRDYERKLQLVECATCGKVFERRNIDVARVEARGGKHYCSRACMGKAYMNRVTLTCSECGKVFERAKSGVNENDKHHFCSKECQAKNTDYILSGEKHWHYITGDKSYKRGANWLEQRRKARERDNYTCQHCGMTEQELGKALDVHHIKPYRLFADYVEANELENLISLCPSCHHRADAQIAK